jgi:hypothetical protein
MTKLTNDMRDGIYHRIIKDLPVRNFIAEIYSLVQEEIIKHAPNQVQELYADELTRKYLNTTRVEVRLGNRNVGRYWHTGTDYLYYDQVYGLKDNMTIRMDDAENTDRLPDGSLYKDIVTKLANEGLVISYFEQEDLRDNVSKRLRVNLRSATTIKKLYEVLEPELHGFIPKDDVQSTLPACVAPVVDDLRKLGALLPNTPKVIK